MNMPCLQLYMPNCLLCNFLVASSVVACPFFSELQQYVTELLEAGADVDMLKFYYTWSADLLRSFFFL
eukprot:m.106424 g.106424  ORF g.106424 m.106424 type:complete len:68 (-) comp15151_c1_seq1:475-678(-)